MEKLMHAMQEYWSGRSAGYSQYNQEEMQDIRRENWRKILLSHISAAFPDRSPGRIRVLDAGAGPGFISILLAQTGYKVTAMDFTPQMIDQAKANAGELSGSITWVLGDVQASEFDDMSFDVVISRNVTWNLPHPEQAYRDWYRVLDTDGILLNFDAGWYNYLLEPEKRLAYETDRENARQKGIEDCNVGENFDRMEELAEKVPLTGKSRPAWDVELLWQIGFDSVQADEAVWEKVWNEDEKISCASTPMFMVFARKPDVKDHVRLYWGKRSVTFLDQKRRELHDPISWRWLAQILPELPDKKSLKILDIGCGPGYFSILLSGLGYDVTGIDLTPEMIEDAVLLAGEEGAACRFLKMDAEHLDFPDQSFDAIVTKNVTWTLPHPEAAYREWLRVLKKDGVLLNFDANYGMVRNERMADLPYNHAHNVLPRKALAENDAIVRQLPISYHKRPAWDAQILGDIGVSSVSVDFRLSEKVFREKDEFYNPVPMFRLAVRK